MTTFNTTRLSPNRLMLAFATAHAAILLNCGAIELTVTNSSFETPILADGSMWLAVPASWGGQGTVAIINPMNAFFSGTTDTSPGPSPIHGLNAAAINYGGELTYQHATHLVQPNVVYTLTLLAGQRSDTPFGNGSVTLWAGTNLLAEGIPNPPPDTFIAFSLSYTSPPAGLVLGKPLRIGLKAPTPNSQAWFDHVRLFVEDLICTPHKATAIAQLYNGIFVGATITDTGCGYTNPPSVTIQGGGGNGATATALLVDGRVSGIQVSNGGCCYTNLPTITFGSPPRVPTVAIRVSKIMVTQNVTVGERYVLESSFDLVVWTPTGPSFIATSDTIETEFDVSLTGRFFRLREEH